MRLHSLLVCKWAASGRQVMLMTVLSDLLLGRQSSQLQSLASGNGRVWLLFCFMCNSIRHHASTEEACPHSCATTAGRSVSVYHAIARFLGRSTRFLMQWPK